MKTFFIFITALFCTIFFSSYSQASLFGGAKTDFLRASDAFHFSYQQHDNVLEAEWQIAKGYYLYRKEIRFNGHNVAFDKVNFPKSEIHQDEYFGETEIYTDHLKLNVQLVDIKDNASIEVIYQGCTEGLCYPPESKTIAINKNITPGQHKNEKNEVTANLMQTESVSQQDQLTKDLFHSKFAIWGFFLLGIGLAFTPCVLPMLPLLSAIILGQGQRPNSRRALLLSICYVQGMALTYTLLGLTVAAIGLPFQMALQSPVVLVTFSILFTILAASMFGLFELKLPNCWQNKLNQLSARQKSGAYGGVFLMGIIAGLIASPCTSAPLSGALLYVVQSGDLIIGGLALYLLALGMGLPLILMTLFGNKILPKSGNWLNIVKPFFGFIMLLLPVILLARVTPQWENQLWVIWSIAFCCWIASKHFWSGFIVALAIFFIAQYFGLTSSNNVRKNSMFSMESTSLRFKKIHSYDELQQALSNNPHSIAMVDLYADWCIACKEFERYTFSDSKVQRTFNDILLLQIDMTKNSSENSELTEKLQVLGLPSILFFNKQGVEISGSRVTGFMDATEFLHWLEYIQSER